MNPKGDIVLITGSNGRIGAAVMKRLREGFDNIVVDARRKGKLFWRPFWTGDAVDGGPIKATYAGRNRHVF